jgi:hypothetical protein
MFSMMTFWPSDPRMCASRMRVEMATRLSPDACRPIGHGKLGAPASHSYPAASASNAHPMLGRKGGRLDSGSPFASGRGGGKFYGGHRADHGEERYGRKNTRGHDDPAAECRDYGELNFVGRSEPRPAPGTARICAPIVFGKCAIVAAGKLTPSEARHVARRYAFHHR